MIYSSHLSNTQILIFLFYLYGLYQTIVSGQRPITTSNAVFDKSFSSYTYARRSSPIDFRFKLYKPLCQCHTILFHPIHRLQYQHFSWWPNLTATRGNNSHSQNFQYSQSFLRFIFPFFSFPVSSVTSYTRASYITVRTVSFFSKTLSSIRTKQISLHFIRTLRTSPTTIEPY